MGLRAASLVVILLGLSVALGAGAGIDHGPYAGSGGDSCQSCHPQYADGNTHQVNELVGCEDCHQVISGAPLMPGKEICADCHGEAEGQPHAAMLEVAHPASKGLGIDSSQTLDALSILCLNCHDGAGLGPMAHFSLPEDPKGVGRAHPIGMDYQLVASFNSKYQDAASLPAEIVLTEGKMGCLSCHNLYLPATAGLLAVDNRGSRLCFSCHNL